MKDNKLRICVLQRGWVVVGRVNQKDQMITVSDGYVVRSWGTTKGLGEIAMNGPTSDTKLDKITDCEFHELSLVMALICNECNWGSVMKKCSCC